LVLKWGDVRETYRRIGDRFDIRAHWCRTSRRIGQQRITEGVGIQVLSRQFDLFQGQKGSREEKIGKVAELIIRELYRNRFISLMAIDSTFVPYYFEKDTDAA